MARLRMDPGRWQEIERLYQAALARPAAERAAYLAEACAGDEGLRREVEALLESPATAEGFLAVPALAVAAKMVNDPAPSVLTGRRLGVYHLLEQIGAGGMGEVYRARDTKLGRDVAIKILPRAFTREAERLSRFEREARVLAALNHPNIAAIYGFEDGPAAAFAVAATAPEEAGPHLRGLVLELVEGETLADRVRRGPVPVGDALTIARQIAEALAAAHEKGIVHRDLKPANIKITPGGVVKVLDFGLAKAAGGDGTGADSHAPTMTIGATHEGVVLGTAAYMSPEQARGQAVDKRTDIWAFGCVLYEILTGRAAFTGNTVSDIIAAILEREPDWRALRGSAPPDVGRVIQRCLTKDPNRRLHDIADARIELEEALKTPTSTQETAAASAGARVSSRGHRKLRPVSRAALALLVVALLMAVGAFGFIIGFRQSAPSSPRITRLTFDRGTVRAARFAADGKTIIYSASWGGQPIKIFQTRIGSPESTPLQLPDAEVLSVSSRGEVALSIGHRFRGWIGQGTLARAPLVGGSFREMLEDVRAADWSPDGNELAIVRRVNDRDRLEYPIGTVLYETAGYISHPRVSASGDVVAYSDHPVFGDNRGWVSIVTRTGQRRTLTREWGSQEGLAWSRDGREIWFAASDETGRNMLFGVTLDGALRQIWAAPANITILDIGRDGRVLATANTIRTEIKWVTEDDSQEREISFYAWSFAKDLTADGRMVLLTRFDEGAGLEYQIGLRRIDAPTGVVLGQGTPSLFSPDSKWIIGVTHREPSLFLLPTGTGERRALTQPGFKYMTAGWFPDGKRIIFAAQENNATPSVYVQDIAGGTPVRVRAAIPPLLTDWGLRVSPNSEWFFGAQATGPPVIIPVSGGEPRALNDLGADDLPVAWTPDGRAILIMRRSDDHMSAAVVRFDLATGRMQTVRHVKVADTSGGRGLTCIVTPDGRTVVYNVGRYLTDLYLVEGLE